MHSDDSQSQSGLETGDILESLHIEDLTIEGQGVARFDGRVVFVDKGIPGELVRARVTRIKKRIVEAETIAQIQPSPHEVPPWCSHFTECGACSWQNMAMDAILDWKRRHIQACFSRIGKLEVSVHPLIPSPESKGFRNKMSFVFGTDQGKATLGLRTWKGHEVVPVEQCGLVPDIVMDVVAHVRNELAGLGLDVWQENGSRGAERSANGYLRFLVVRSGIGKNGQSSAVTVECITSPEHDRELAGRSDLLTNAGAVKLLGAGLMKQFPLGGFIHSERRSASSLAQSERLVEVIGDDFLSESVGGKILDIPYNAFFQTNPGMAAHLYRLIEQEANLTGNETVWDLYCGVGAIGLFLADKARQVAGFELQKEAVRAARHNAEKLGYTHCTFHAGDICVDLCRKLPSPDVIIADPPRSGLSGQAIEMLKAVPAKKLLYVSCNPSTQARDAAALATDWTPVKSLPLDMFPFTPHVENLLVLERRKG